MKNHAEANFETKIFQTRRLSKWIPDGKEAETTFINRLRLSFLLKNIRIFSKQFNPLECQIKADCNSFLAGQG